MTKKKSLKTALFMSGLSMLTCGAMLAGTTFAWFSDTATSGQNTIVAGNLKVELQYNENAGTSGEEKWTSAENVSLFEDVDLWEPGVMTVSAPFKVVNTGTLALTYALSLKVNEEVKTDAGYSLFDVIKYKLVTAAEANAYIEEHDPREGKFDRAQAWEDFAEKDAKIPLVLHAEGDKCEEEDSEHVPEAEEEAEVSKHVTETEPLVLVLYWAPNSAEIDNRYNGTGKDGQPLSIRFGISVFATQTPYEKDGIGNGYDKNLPFAKIYTAVEEGVGAANSALEEQGLQDKINISDLEEAQATVTFTGCEVMDVVKGYGIVAEEIEKEVTKQKDNIQSINIGGVDVDIEEENWLTLGLAQWGFTIVPAAQQPEGDPTESLLEWALAMFANLNGKSCDVTIITTDGMEVVYTLSFVIENTAEKITEAVKQGVTDANSALFDKQLGEKITISELGDDNKATVTFTNCSQEDFFTGYMAVAEEIEKAVKEQSFHINSISIDGKTVDLLNQEQDWLMLGLARWGYDKLLTTSERAQVDAENNFLGQFGMLAKFMIGHLNGTSCDVTITTTDGVATTYTLSFVIEGEVTETP